MQMTRVSTADFIKNYGTLADKALREPVTITKNGKDRLVLVSAEEFEHMRRSYRRVVRIEEWTDEEIALLDKTIDAIEPNAELDKELEGWTP
jgi:prevent-host-death family protein